MVPGRPDNTIRGPQEFRELEEPADGYSRVLIPMVFGGVVYLARRAAGFTNGTFAAALNVSSPTITHLERGVITVTTYHLDIIAYVLTPALKERLGLDNPGWQGWQLAHVATRIIEQLESLGHVCVWDSPRRETDLSEYLSRDTLLELIETLWPPEYEGRLA